MARSDAHINFFFFFKKTTTIDVYLLHSQIPILGLEMNDVSGGCRHVVIVNGDGVLEKLEQLDIDARTKLDCTWTEKKKILLLFYLENIWRSVRTYGHLALAESVEVVQQLLQHIFKKDLCAWVVQKLVLGLRWGGVGWGLGMLET